VLFTDTSAAASNPAQRPPLDPIIFGRRMRWMNSWTSICQAAGARSCEFDGDFAAMPAVQREASKRIAEERRAQQALRDLDGVQRHADVLRSGIATDEAWDRKGRHSTGPWTKIRAAGSALRAVREAWASLGMGRNRHVEKDPNRHQTWSQAWSRIRSMGGGHAAMLFMLIFAPMSFLVGCLEAVGSGRSFATAPFDPSVFAVGLLCTCLLFFFISASPLHRRRLDDQLEQVKEQELRLAKLHLFQAAERGHELRNGLAGLAGTASLCESRPLGADASRLRSAMAAELARLNALLGAPDTDPRGTQLGSVVPLARADDSSHQEAEVGPVESVSEKAGALANTIRSNASATVKPYPMRIIDSHELFSTSLTIALRGRGFDAHQVPVARIQDFLARSTAGPVGLVVLDLDLGRDADGNWVHGSGLVKGLHTWGWKVLIVSGSVDQPGVAAAIASGAIGSVPKSSPFERLMHSVVIAAENKPIMTEVEHQHWLAMHRRYRAQEIELSRRLSRLSVREREVLELIAEGHRAASIAEHFVVSMTTVRTQIRAILAKLEINSQLEAVALIRKESQPPPVDRTPRVGGVRVVEGSTGGVEEASVHGRVQG
jgi:DNA-binding NarL/FixJ family response regulator